MTVQTSELSAELHCDRCGYDLRAHPQDGKCPECGMSVAESQRLAANPRRPAWRDSDPRWRRRMLAGIWILVLLPLMDLLTATGWASHLSVPTIFNYRGTFGTCTLNDALTSWGHVYPFLTFCIGVVLLFSKERGRRRGRLDWTRRWGVLCSYVVLLLSAAPFLVISALVLAGISAIFLSMPTKYQPGVTQFFVEVSTGYLRYGPYPKDIAGVVVVAFSSITILLACFRLFDALRSTASKQFAYIPLAPLALFALLHLAEAARYCFDLSIVSAGNFLYYQVYFLPELLVEKIFGFPVYSTLLSTTLGDFLMEVIKWCAVLSIAVWLTIAQFTAWRRRKKPPAGITGPAAGVG